MLSNSYVDIQDFLKLTGTGLTVASYVQVKEAIVRRYKQIYGSDIDLSSASADGVFVNDLSLIINNILQTVSTMYANLDVNSASGRYLDILCRLSNIVRKQPTKSTATIEIENLNDFEITIPAQLICLDVSGTEWTTTNQTSFTLSANETRTVNVVCSKFGPIPAIAGSINKALDASLNVAISQTTNATIGSAEESDAALRARRSQSNGASGVSVLESLVAALLEISGIDDCKIYNNSSSEVLQSPDESAPLDRTQMTPHSIYVILRKRENVVISNELIGSLIYRKLTPGIRTNAFIGGESGEKRSYTYLQNVFGQVGSAFAQDVYWKEAKPIAPELSITITPKSYFSANLLDESTFGQNDEFETIAKQVTDYMNSLQLGVSSSLFDLQSVVIAADPRFKNQPTFSVKSIDFDDTNQDTYYNYTTFSVKKSESDYIITLS